MKYTELPPGEQWHNPENAAPPPEGWRFCLGSEVRSNSLAKKVPCRVWDEVGMEYFEDSDPTLLYEEEYSYIVPDTTPFNIPHSGVSEHHLLVDDSPPVVGIPLRAYFAGLAMQGMVSSSSFRSMPESAPKPFSVHNPFSVFALASQAVECADALIAALEGKEGV